MNMLPIVAIIRLEENFQYGTFGVLRINKEVFCVTLEPPDIFNQPNKSSIPAQQYICSRYASERHGLTFAVENVPMRYAVLFHPGNTGKNTIVCILLGEHFGKLKDDRAILNSGKTFDRFMEEMRGHDRFHLTIKELY